MELTEILCMLDSAHGPSGDEGDIRAVIHQLARPWADEITSDVMGNLVARKKGSGPKVMFAAHMDSIGFIVTHIEKEGFLRVGCRPFPTSPRSFGKGLQFTPVSVVIVGCDIQPVFRNIITQVCQIKNMFRLYTASQYLQILIVARGKRRVYCS